MDDIQVHGAMIGLCLLVLLGLSTTQVGVASRDGFLEQIHRGRSV